MRFLRSIIREALRENIFLMDLPGTIRMMVDVYLKAPNTNCHTVKDINLGACMDFAEDIIEKCGGETRDFYMLDTGMFYDDNLEGEPDHQYQNTIETVDGGVWNKDALDEYGYPPDPQHDHVGIHQWVFYKGKHYDAEAPDGVDSPWKLPFFDRQIKGESPYLNEIDDEDEEQEEDFSHLKDEAYIKTLFPLLAAAAQKVYDEWEQDEDGVDEVLGTGGICQDIAGGMADVMISHGIDCSTVSQSVGEQHVYCICKIQEGVYEVDIPPYSYESGGGYTWRKLPNIKFDESYIVIHRLSSDPNDFEQYTGDW